ncbi:bifunctional homocysteine S-methyltransferase/methylenetetrahydrofolate reductase [Geoalkalibacter sp.]|uniref:bifunctional homocysteine S-methyltransferase/methylenetetrahydrofolate reductase n=1 Tax=Geoalkalibacter sp. TaxID=3041440 RepID=UPI00272EBEEB|nr:bifunctional homocysteine S-methyltransferase/methylenetetrahydrofolate reductase [Geoalkalibacter sp.]
MPAYPPRSQRFLDLLTQRVLVGDGAMGTLLYQRGVALDANFEHLNLVRPQLVAAVHADYVAAGAEVLETNTFGGNRLRLGAIGLEHRVAAINAAGARLARQAAGPERFVAGAVGPLPQARAEEQELSAELKREIFREQMSALAEGGVDLFILETFSSLEDLRLALAAAAELGLPASAQLAFLEGGRTREGVAAESAAQALEQAGAALIGANCGAGPRDLLAVLRRLAPLTRRPLAAFANSGFPQYREGRFMYLATPEYFAARGREMAEAGATLIGGCCGTTPEHIGALAQALRGLKPVPRPALAPRPAETTSPVAAAGAAPNFLAAWGQRPVISVELDPPRGLDCTKVLAAAAQLRAAGADAISLAENPLARIRMGNLALAVRIQEQCGLPVIAHVTCRDRNLIGLHSDLMGAHLLGLRNILAVTGDPVSLGGESGASSVFDLNSIGLLELLSALNQGRNLLGAELDGRTEFLLGAALNPNVRNLDGQLRRLEKKIAAGARFVQTQPIYSAAVLDELIARTAPLGIPVLVGLLPLVSERNAEFLHNEVPGITLPDEVRRRMRGLRGEEGIREGLAIAAELIAAGRGRVGGWYLMPPFGKVGLALALMEQIRATER